MSAVVKGEQAFPLSLKFSRLVVAHEFWVMLFCLPFLLFPGPLSPAGLTLVLLPWFCRRAVQGHFTRGTALDWPVLGLLVMSLVSFWSVFGRKEGLVVLFQILAGASLFYGVVNWASSKERLILVAALSVLGGTALAVVAPLVTRWPANKHFLGLWPEIYTAFPGLGLKLWPEESVHPNVLAGALAPLVVIGFSLFYEIPSSFLKREKWLARIALALALGSMVLILALTQSRGGWLAVTLGLVTFGSLHYRWFLVVLPIFTLEALALAGRFELLSLLNFLMEDSSLGGPAGRLEVWRRVWEMIRHSPLTGIGLGTFPASPPDLSTLGHAHNLFLQVALALGLPGLGFFLALLALGGWQALKVCRGGMLPALAGGLFSSLVAIIVHGLLDAVLWGTKTSVILWLILGLICALYNTQIFVERR